MNHNKLNSTYYHILFLKEKKNKSLVSNTLDFNDFHDKLYSSLMFTIISSYLLLWSNHIPSNLYLQISYEKLNWP